ncbi:hypothetical protein ACFV19_32895 [Streptomyces griseoluteus]|uniref:hypothetical protein n=1 Tax=Streptomyces griseoluteus TaxID=29306 RepID=UPI00368E7F37
MNIAVHGSRSLVVVTSAPASGESSAGAAPAAGGEPGLFDTTGRRVSAVVVGLATVIGTGTAPWSLMK